MRAGLQTLVLVAQLAAAAWQAAPAAQAQAQEKCYGVARAGENDGIGAERGARPEHAWTTRATPGSGCRPAPA